MIPAAGGVGDDRFSIPRESGDDPKRRIPGARKLPYSPRERG